jgi:hypothetical protein
MDIWKAITSCLLTSFLLKMVLAWLSKACGAHARAWVGIVTVSSRAYTGRHYYYRKRNTEVKETGYSKGDHNSW